MPARSLRAIAPAAALILLTLITYFPTLSNGFIWDDQDHLTHGPADRTAHALKLYWTRFDAAPQYYPLTHTVFWLEGNLWQQNPIGYHAVNIAIAATNALLVWLILRRLSIRGAWLAAAIFAIHPLQVETVAWASELKNLLSGLFYLLAMLTAVKAWRLDENSAAAPTSNGDTTPQARDFPLPPSAFHLPPSDPPSALHLPPSDPPSALGLSSTYLLFLLALLCKTVVSTFPAALLLLIWWKRGKITRNDFLAVLPMFIAGAVFGSITRHVETDYVGASGPDFQLLLSQRILIAGHALWFYAAKLFWPRQLIFVYPRWIVDPGQPINWLYPAAAVAAIAILVALVRRTGRSPLAAVLYFAGTLAPALGFLNVYPMRFTFVADHYQYLACLGLIVLLVSAAIGLIEHRRALTFIARPVAAVLILLLAGRSWMRTHDYLDAMTLWSDTAATDPDSWIAFENLGTEYARRGDMIVARYLFETSLKIHPNQAEAHLDLGRLLEDKGDFAAARRQFELAAPASPDDARAELELARLARRQSTTNPIAATGELASPAQAEDAEARNLYAAIVADHPRNVVAALEFIQLLIDDHQPADAEAQCRRLLAVNPEIVPAWRTLANLQYQRGDIPGALGSIEEAIARGPDDADTSNTYGILLLKSGRTDEAIDQFQLALKLNPVFIQATQNLAVARQRKAAPR
jgi:tetratricopeptide (TPR) repeat protein